MKVKISYGDVYLQTFWKITYHYKAWLIFLGFLSSFRLGGRGEDKQSKDQVLLMDLYRTCFFSSAVSLFLFVLLLVILTAVLQISCSVTLGGKSIKTKKTFPLFNVVIIITNRNNSVHLFYFRWQTRGTYSVQQPWQSCIWGNFCAVKWTSQAPTRSLLFLFKYNILFVFFI